MPLVAAAGSEGGRKRNWLMTEMTASIHADNKVINNANNVDNKVINNPYGLHFFSKGFDVALKFLSGMARLYMLG